MGIVRIKSTHPESQGEFVEINASDFDPKMGHELYEPPQVKPRPAEPSEAKKGKAK